MNCELFFILKFFSKKISVSIFGEKLLNESIKIKIGLFKFRGNSCDKKTVASKTIFYRIMTLCQFLDQNNLIFTTPGKYLCLPLQNRANTSVCPYKIPHM
ncbi:MAG: hypothetical protein DRR19_21775 [Candidatus Parabeggiatoa sp. nov. 1]|nr:MAG: hypothetical protein DRR19_21775 [Gammaproteobacteria bacterium]